MRSVLLFGILCISAFISGCSGPATEKKNTKEIEDLTVDRHTYSNTKEVYTTHLHLELDVNFDNKTVYGVARHQMKNIGADTAVFDMKWLEIQKITLGKKNEKETDFMIGAWDKDSIMGQPLRVKIDPETEYINIYYKTTERTEALDWLSPELTNGKIHPYLYTQGQAILTRSWIPIQDSPSNRITYSADVKVPSDLMAVMSASNPTSKNTEGKYHFEMKQPIPAYLISLAVGDLAYRKLGPNCGVYSEPGMIQACANEFVDLPKMIKAAERLYGSYLWEQYDLIVLPYSFPFGGMENPRLTFVNPTVLAGDRSLVSVVAHELAHSWSGNLVTNETWNDFWLNEGFTVYFENRIMEQLYGREVADMLALIEFHELKVEMDDILSGTHPEDTKLKLALTDRNPDDGMTQIAYVKGAFFLKTLEEVVGRVKFDLFLKSYFKEFAFKTITTENFRDYLNEKLLKPNNLTFNTDEWIYEEGLPKNCVQVTSSRFNDMTALANRFAVGEDIFKKEVTYVKIKGSKRKKRVVKEITREKHITQEWQTFIRNLPKDIGKDRMSVLDDHLNFKACGNTEIMTEWYVLGIKNGYTEIKPDIEKFLIKIGRRKYLIPIYKALAETKENKSWARKVFEKAKSGYHYVSRSTVESILK